MNSGDSRYYWVRSVGPGGTSTKAPDTTTGVIGTTVLLATADYQNLSIVNALIADATIDSAKIVSLDASKIKADSILSGTIKVSSSGTQTTLTSLSTTASQGVTDAAAAKTAADAAAALGAANAAQATANDPATKINSATTLIDPGKVVIAGATTLANWRNGSDVTAIEGGKIAANTIKANSLSIGVRGVQITGLQFTPDKAKNTVTFTAGKILYIDDSGAVASVDIPAGGPTPVGSSAQPLYIVWARPRKNLDWTYDQTVPTYFDHIVLATYNGGSNLVVNYGGTIIDGDQIITGTIKANRIESNSIGASQLSTGQLITTTAQIKDGIISTAHIQNAYINNAQISGDIASSNWSGGGNGKPNSATGWYLQRASGKLYANDIEIRDHTGNIVFQSNGNLDWGRVSSKPYLGAFSGLDSITSANIGTYIAGAAIGEAYIGSGAITTAKIGDAQINTLKVANYAVSAFSMTEYSNQAMHVVVDWQHAGWDWQSMGVMGLGLSYESRIFIHSVNRHYAHFANFGQYYRARCVFTQQLIWRPPWAGGNWGAICDHQNFVDLNGNGIYEVSYLYPLMPTLAYGGTHPAGYYEFWYRCQGETMGLTSSQWHFNYNQNRILAHYSYR
ncbi:MAG: hypothetical protein EOO77_13525 [Oxalobacteraceae bacterium]|nr:MAG: hypothetical protein EOO77_13525 [Oxalobacteraceae bacterium]